MQDQRSQTELTSNVLAILERDAQELQQQDSNSFFTIRVQGLIRGLQEAEHDNDRLRTENAAFRRELQEAPWLQTYPADRDRDEASDVWSEAPALQDQRSQTELTSNVLAILERDAQELQQQDSNSFFTIRVQGLIRGLQEAEHDTTTV